MPLPSHSLGNMKKERSSSFRTAAVGIWSALLLSDALLLGRRLSGELHLVPEGLVVGSTTCVALLSFLAWMMIQRGMQHQEKWTALAHPLRAFCVLIPFLWGITTGWGASSFVAGCVAAIVLTQALATLNIGSFEVGLRPDIELSPQILRPRETSFHPGEAVRFVPATRESSIHLSTGQPTTSDRTTSTLELVTANEDDGEESGDDDSIEDVGSQDDVTHWQMRRASDGQESIEGWVAVLFESGQREAVIHLAFCPPLASSPQVETEDLDGVGIEIKVTSAYTFGLRISVRRSRICDNAAAHRIGFVAISTIARRAA